MGKAAATVRPRRAECLISSSMAYRDASFQTNSFMAEQQQVHDVRMSDEAHGAERSGQILQLIAYHQLAKPSVSRRQLTTMELAQEPRLPDQHMLFSARDLISPPARSLPAHGLPAPDEVLPPIITPVPAGLRSQALGVRIKQLPHISFTLRIRKRRLIIEIYFCQLV
jgi:hypothetical protein